MVTRVCRGFLVALVVAVSGCGVGATAFGADCGGVRGWVGESSDSAVFISWTDDDGELSGTLDYRTLAPGSSGAAELEATTVAFTGNRDGESVTLSLQHGLGAVTNLNGTLDGDQLSLVGAEEDGSLSTTRLREGCSDEFNTAVESLRQQAAADEQRVANEAATEAMTSAFAEAAEGLDAATAELQASAKALRRAASSAEVALGGVQSAVDQLRAKVEDLRVVADNYNGSYEDDVALDDAFYAVDDADYAVDDTVYALDDAYYEADQAGSSYKDAAERVATHRAAVEDGSIALDLPSGSNDFSYVDQATANARETKESASDRLDNVRSQVLKLKREQKEFRREAATLYDEAFGV